MTVQMNGFIQMIYFVLDNYMYVMEMYCLQVVLNGMVLNLLVQQQHIYLIGHMLNL